MCVPGSPALASHDVCMASFSLQPGKTQLGRLRHAGKGSRALDRPEPRLRAPASGGALRKMHHPMQPSRPLPSICDLSLDLPSQLCFEPSVPVAVLVVALALVVALPGSQSNALAIREA